MPSVNVRNFHKMFTTRVFATLTATLVLSLPCAAAWPDRAITIIVGAAPGGTGDQAARCSAEPNVSIIQEAMLWMEMKAAVETSP